MARCVRNALSEPLAQRNDDGRGAADETEPVHVLVFGDVAYEFSAMCAQAGKEVYDRPDRARILKYGKIAYRLHARDNERYADAWKAFRLCG